jgi:hypothetical protein
MQDLIGPVILVVTDQYQMSLQSALHIRRQIYSLYTRHAEGT